MRNYIKAELYRNFNRYYFWVFTAIMALCAIAAVCLGKYVNIKYFDEPTVTFSLLLEFLFSLLSIPVYLIVVFVDMVSNEDNKHLVTKNVVSHGMSRTKLYISKIIVSTILAFISAAIILIPYILFGLVLLGVDEATTQTLINNIVMYVLAAIPLWIGAISLCTFLSYVFKSNAAFAFVYGIIIAITGNIVDLLGRLVSDKFYIIYNNLITTQFEKMNGMGVYVMNECLVAHMVAVGICFIVVFAVLGAVYVQKIEFR